MMTLIIDDSGWPMFVSSWAVGWPPSGNQSNVQYLWDNGGTPATSRVVIPVGEDVFLKYVEDNTDDNGVCDLRPMQKSAGK